MLTEEFKKEFREFLQEDIFSTHVSFLFNPVNLTNEINYNERVNIVFAPLLYRDDLLQFLQDEGLFITDCHFAYKVSIAE